MIEKIIEYSARNPVIVFLLIGFYLLVSQLMSSRTDFSVQLPTMRNPVVQAARPAEFVINLRRDGTVTLEGRVASLDAVGARLRARLDRAAAKNERLRVIVRADRRGRFGQLDEVLGLCRRAGVEQIIMRTVRGAGR